MAKKKLTKNTKIIIAVVVIHVVLLAFIGVIIYFYIFATSPVARKKMLKHYSDDSNYVEVYAKIKEAPHDFSGGNMYIPVEFVGDVDRGFIANSAHGFELPQTDYDIMIENGIDFENNETVYKFVASPWIWWDGGQPFAVAMYSEDGQTTYLDYETGKSNLLYYIEKVMK